ncbi:hypothetical protein L249_4190, partial [Ophiocordyceps polyrhachis-furcata BCC 54312]
KEEIKEELEAGEVFVLRRYFLRYFKVPTCSTLTYLYTCSNLTDLIDLINPIDPIDLTRYNRYNVPAIAPVVFFIS